MRILIGICFLLLLSSCTTTYYLVRHAEKRLDQGSDPDLTPEGQQRAEALWALLEDKGIDSIFVTQYKRTQQTAAPTATGTGETVQIMNAGQVNDIVMALKAIPRNKSVLVVGHSNTTTQIVDGLMESAQGIIINDATEFDNLFIVRIKHQNPKKRSLKKLKYGEPSL